MEVSATKKALEVIELLKKKHGQLLFEQSAGCCEGTVPILIEADGHYLSSQLIQVGTIANVPYYVEKPLMSYLQYMNTEIDVLDGTGASFSLESAEGYAFIARATPLTK